MLLHPARSFAHLDAAATDRRGFLRGGLGALAAGLAGSAGAVDPGDPWQQQHGAPVRETGEPSPLVPPLRRSVLQGYGAIAPGTGSSWTPLERLHGIITPAPLHFERHHAGVPAVDPARFALVIHGRVSRPLRFDLDALARYPMDTRMAFLECAGNSLANTQPEPQQKPCGQIHGLLSCSEWTGIPLRLLLEEAGADLAAGWMLAEGGDPSSLARSIPLAELDRMMLALYQNGEPLRPEQGFPWRLLIPGWEGNVNIKWLRRLKVMEGPAHTRDETARYTDLLRDGRAEQFTLPMAVKSVITHPSATMRLREPGFYEISGLAWTGAGRIRSVEVSVDAGAIWVPAVLQEPVLSRSLVRFRLPWRWSGAPAVLQSRATDETGAVQPLRADWIARYAPGQRYHCNAIQSWAVDTDGAVRNVYA